MPIIYPMRTWKRIEEIMEIEKSPGVFCIIFWIVVLCAGCSSSSGGGNSTPESPGYQTYTTSGSGLVLQIPDTLAVSQENIEEIHYYADQVSHCRVTTRETVNIVLAEACVFYDVLYLFPDYFPTNLDSLFNVSGYVNYLRINDPFTFYLSQEDYSAYMLFYSGFSASIGFTADCNGLTVTDETPLFIDSIYPYTRAWIDGLQVGDKIVGLDGISIEGMNLDAVGPLLPASEGETVEITIERDDVEITFFTAAEENIGLRLYNDIAYLSVRSFTETTGEEVRLDYEELQIAAGGQIDKLILDLRHNGGGAITGALTLADYLIDLDNGSYPIMSVSRPAYGDSSEYLGDHNEFNIGDYDKTNFVLLVDEYSASASEIVAAALKHYDTATLMGWTTYGKGIGQSIAPLIDEAAVVVPSMHSLPPSGVSYHGIGIHPDYYSAGLVTSFDDDPVLDAAIEYLTTEIVTATVSIQVVKEKQITASESIVDPLQKMLREKVGNENYF